jgi:hypothetical protein
MQVVITIDRFCDGMLHFLSLNFPPSFKFFKNIFFTIIYIIDCKKFQYTCTFNNQSFSPLNVEHNHDLIGYVPSPINLYGQNAPSNDGNDQFMPNCNLETYILHQPPFVVKANRNLFDINDNFDL